MDTIVSLKDECNDFTVEFDVLPAVDSLEELDERKKKIEKGISEADSQLQLIQEKITKYNTEIERLTCHADGIDYAIAVTCGILTGMFDIVVVGEWDFKSAKAASNKEINDKVMAFAKKDTEYAAFIENKRKNKDPDRLDNAIEFLENKYKLPGDGAYKNFKNLGVTDSTHHLDDFCHHPTLIGLVCCILVQFTGNATYHTSTGGVIKTPIEINEYGKLVSEEKWGKVFAGLINWFFNVARTMQNREGHLMSDMAGSSTSAGKGNEGSGLPGSFLSTAKEISNLPCFKDSNFSENLRKAYQSGIGTGKKQVDLGPFNSLFQGASSKMDMRTEMAVKHELKRQAVPVIMNEILVRGLYFVRRFISQMKEKKSVIDLDWKEVMPFHNRTIVRMMTIASGTFTAIDMADAAIHSAIKSGGFASPIFLSNMILRVNFVGIGRFAIAVGTDVGMGAKCSYKRNERIKIFQEQLAWSSAKLFYKTADMWLAAEDAETTINEAYDIAEKSIIFYVESMRAIATDMKEIESYISSIEQKNSGMLKEIDDILIWGEM